MEEEASLCTIAKANKMNRINKINKLGLLLEQIWKKQIEVISTIAWRCFTLIATWWARGGGDGEPISLADWFQFHCLINSAWVEPARRLPHTVRNLPFEAKNIKHDRYFPLGLAWRNSQGKFSREETAEQAALPAGHLLSCFLSCAEGLMSLVWTRL